MKYRLIVILLISPCMILDVALIPFYILRWLIYGNSNLFLTDKLELWYYKNNYKL